MGQYMDKVFGQGTQQKTMLNKMIGRAFVTVALPVALSLGHPSLAVAQTAEKFANDPRIQLAPQQVTDNMNTQAPKKFEGTFKAFPTSSLILGSTTPAFLDSTIDQLNKWDNNGEVDLARDTGLRYLGYANETGESFKFIAPQFLTPSYALAYGYCLADGLYKGLHYFYDNGQVMSSGVFKAFGDALIFQCFASVLIPGNIIAFIVETSDEKFKELEATKDNEAVNKWGPTVLGLGSIPFIVHPIDVSVDWVMEHSIRLLYGFF